MRKEYNDRWNAPLVNPPVTAGEWENRVKQCDDCGKMLDTKDSEVKTCYECYAESFRKGN